MPPPAKNPHDWHERAALFAALGHPLRIRTLAALREGVLSPAQLERLLAEPEAKLGVLAYHFRRLERAGLVELASTRHRRGAIEHCYALTARGREAARILGTVELAGRPRARAGQ
jgi:DNA-binding transcriptional ArsR family regulator